MKQTRTWLFQVKNYLQATSFNINDTAHEAACINFTGALLRGAAATWLRHIVTKKGPYTSWTIFEQDFLS